MYTTVPQCFISNDQPYPLCKGATAPQGMAENECHTCYLYEDFVTKEIERAIISNCPVCGKQPKVKRDIGYEYSGFGAWCIIQCKPLFGKPHKRVQCGKSTWDRALLGAIAMWENVGR